MPVTVLQDRADGLDGQGLDAGEDLGLGGLEDAVETAQQDQWQDDAAVLGLLVVAAQQIGDGPDEAGVVVGRGVVRGGAGLGQVVPPECVAVLPYSSDAGQAGSGDEGEISGC